MLYNNIAAMSRTPPRRVDGLQKSILAECPFARTRITTQTTHARFEYFAVKHRISWAYESYGICGNDLNFFNYIFIDPNNSNQIIKYVKSVCKCTYSFAKIKM